MSSSVRASDVPPESILHYIPNIPGNIAFGALYEVAAVLLFLNLLGRRDWWALCLPIGAALQGAGFFVRIPLIDQSGSLAVYIPQQFLIVLAPACYFAFNYIWFGRLVQRLEERSIGLRRNGTKATHLAILSPSKYGLVFIISDVTTFLIQAAGGGMTVQESLSNIGSTIFLIGIIAQFVSYIVFCMLATIVVVRIGLFRSAASTGYFTVQAQRRLRGLLVVLVFSSIWIIVRSVFRTIELQQGYDGSLSQSESWFFGLDAAPLLLAIGIYIFAWPSSFVELKDHASHEHFAMPINMAARKQQFDWHNDEANMPPLSSSASYYDKVPLSNTSHA